MTGGLAEGDAVFSVDAGLEGQVLAIAEGRAQVWWSDDDVSWEQLETLERRGDTPTTPTLT